MIPPHQQHELVRLVLIKSSGVPAEESVVILPVVVDSTERRSSMVGRLSR